MLQQYLEYKKQYPDCLILIQVGDFYEAFFEDAVTISKRLNLTLTSRDKNSDNPIPMCGVPLSVVDNYASRLIDQDLAVAIVSQVGPTGKGPVQRKLERIITPGIQLLGNANSQNDQIIASLYFDFRSELESTDKFNFSLAYCYPASGCIGIFDNLDRESLLLKFSQLLPKELILPKNIEGKSVDRRLTMIRELERRNSNLILRSRADQNSKWEQSSRDINAIPGYSLLDPSSKSACRLLINYLDEVTVDQMIPIQKVIREQEVKTLLIDASTRNNLDLITNQRTGNQEGSLLNYLDQTKTAGGQRQLKRWVLAPSCNLQILNDRQATITKLLQHYQETENFSLILEKISDLERLATRIELQVINPRELASVRDSLLFIKQLKNLTADLNIDSAAGFLNTFVTELVIPEKLITLLVESLQSEPAVLFNDGNIFNDSYHPDLTYFRNLKTNGQALIKQLEEAEKIKTNISSLKIRYNNLQGYFLEVTKANLDKVPEHFIRKQSTVSSERFYTPELKKLEEDLVSAESKLINLERELFQELRNKVLLYSQELRVVYQLVAELDVLIGFTRLSEQEDLVAPKLQEHSQIMIQQGRHPILSQMLKNDFVCNDLFLSPKAANCMILTGPNMGGKSTYLRQAALIVIMAQIGSFVPAESAEIGLVDRIFARIGASDDLMEGDSTFMLEMKEASEIIRSSTERSLILVDELGRGTSTTDGYAIAQAVLEWLIIETKARTLFATHFHQLTQLANQYPEVCNYSVASVDIDEQVLFTHEIVPGPANNSYGLEVAKLAGLPRKLLERAALIINSTPVETNRMLSASSQITLFSEVAKPSVKELQKAFPKKAFLESLEKKIKEIDPNQLSPRKALEIIYQLNEQVHADSKEN